MSTTVNESKRHLEINATEFDGQLDGTIKTNTTAITQSAGDNSTKVATTAYADAVLPGWVPSSNPNYLTSASLSGYATENYVQTQVTNLIDSAPSALDTLNELAAALGDDANFSTTVTNSIATKLPLAGGTMTGAITMVDSNVISGSGDVKIYARSTDTGASFMQFQNTSTGSSNSDGLTVGVNSTTAYIWQREAANLLLGTNDTTAVTLNSSQNATFEGRVDFKKDFRLRGTDSAGSQGVTRFYVDSNEKFHIDTANDGNNTFTLDVNGNATFAGDIHVGANYVGRDGDNYIGFVTDDLIKFRVAGATQVKISDGVLSPQTDSDVDLGTNSVRFANIYGDTLYGDGSNLTNVSATDSTKLPLSGGTLTGDLTISSTAPNLILEDTNGRSIEMDVNGNTFRIDDVGNNAAIFTSDLSTNPIQTTFGGPLSTGSYSLTGGSLDINGNADISGNLTGVDAITMNGALSGVSTATFAGDVQLLTSSGEYALYGAADAQTQLYHNGVKKLETTSNGIDVTGEVQGDSLDIDGNADISGTLNMGGAITASDLDHYKFTASTNDSLSFTYNSRNMAMPLNSYLWHDLLGFDYNYTRTQEISTDGTNFSSHTLDKSLFSQKQDQSVTVIDTNEKAVRWTFQGVAWSLPDWINLAFTYVSSDISKDVLVESSTNGSTWTTRHTSTVSAGTATKSLHISSFGGDSYLRLTITKNPTSSTNVVRLSSIRLMTARAGDQGQGMEFHFPYTWDYDRRIAIGHSPTTSTYEASLAIKGLTADSSAHSLVIRNSSNTSLLSVRNDGRVDIPSGNVHITNDLTVNGNAAIDGTITTDRLSLFTSNTDRATIQAGSSGTTGHLYLNSYENSDLHQLTWSGANNGFYPQGASGTFSLGLSGNRWSNVYTTALNASGNITVGGTVDGRDLATDGTKLDTIDTNADVTPSWVPSSDPSYLTSVPAQTWASITGKPSTFTPSAHNQAWSTITGTPTTISGYGITNAYTKTEVDTAVATKAADDAVVKLTGDQTITGVKSFTGELHWDLDAGQYAGDPRAVVMGYSGGNYGQLGYNIDFTSTSGAHNRVFNDIPTRMDLYDGIRLYSSAAGSAGTSISWGTAVFRAQSNGFQYKGNDIYYAGNDSGILNSNVTLASLGAAASSHNHDDRYYTETESDARYLLDSEVTNLADVKAFDTTDYATAAQGTKADTAHGWGNHASGGYATLSGSQTFTGTKTFNTIDIGGGTITGNVSLEADLLIEDGQSFKINSSASHPKFDWTSTNLTLMSAQGSKTTIGDDVDVESNLEVGSNLTVTGGEITLGGTGKITGIDTVTAATHAANKSYVDTQVATRAASSHSHTFSSITSKPTTISGYGITDAFDGAYGSLSGVPSTFTPSSHTHTFASLTSKPTTISGYGITDAFDGAYGSLSGRPTIPSGNQIIDWTANGAGTIHASNYTNTTYSKASFDLDHLFTLVGATADTSENMGAYTSTSVPANQTIRQNIEALSTRKENIIVACSDETSDLTTGTGKVTFRMPYAMQITEVRASLTTATASGIVTVDIHLNGTSIFASTDGNHQRITIDAGERTSTTAATAYNFVNSASFVTFGDDAEVRVDLDAVGTEGTGKGLKVTLIGYQR